MAQTYEVKYGDLTVGTARAEKQGLYFCFSCRCRLPEEGMYRIHVVSDGVREDLGICVPMEGAFGIDKMIPAKRLGEEALTFEMVHIEWTPPAAELSKPAVLEEEKPEPVQIFIPVSEEEPFEHLDELENAVMEVRDDVPGIVIQKTPEQ